MQEFKVIANNYSAEFGHSTGGVVTMSTRSGTNEFHGSIFESLRNDVLNARNFFAPTKPPIRLNQFGGCVRRANPERQDAFLRHMGTDAADDQRHHQSQRSRHWQTARATSRIFEIAAGNPILIYDPATTSGRIAWLSRQPHSARSGSTLSPKRLSTTFRCRTGQGRRRTPATTSEAAANTLDRNICRGAGGSSIQRQQIC